MTSKWILTTASWSTLAWLFSYPSLSFLPRVFRWVSSPWKGVFPVIGFTYLTPFLLNTLACMKCCTSFSTMVMGSTNFDTTLVRISRYPMRGRLYLIISPDHPFNALLRLSGSTIPLVVPTTEYKLLDFLREYVLPTSSTHLIHFWFLVFSFQLIFTIALLIALYMCFVDVIRSSDSMLWLSRESRTLSRKMKLHQRTYRFEPPAWFYCLASFVWSHQQTQSL